MAGSPDRIFILFFLWALVAANFLAAAELSRLLGNDSIFKSSYHEGPDYNVYAYDVNDDLLLAVIFGPETKTGAVWFYTKQAAAALAEMDLEQSGETSSEIENLTGSIDQELDNLFGAGAGANAAPAGPGKEPDNDASLMNLKEAIRAGIVPSSLLEGPTQ